LRRLLFGWKVRLVTGAHQIFRMSSRPWTPPKQVANLRGTIGVSQEYSGFAFVHVKGASRGREGVFHMALDCQPSALRRIPFGFVPRATSQRWRDFPPALSRWSCTPVGGQSWLSTLVDIPVDYRGGLPPLTCSALAWLVARSTGGDEGVCSGAVVSCGKP
jgi:hypothetical protein